MGKTGDEFSFITKDVEDRTAGAAGKLAQSVVLNEADQAVGGGERGKHLPNY